MGVYTQTNTFSNGTTADGGQVNTEIVNLGASVNDITNAQVNSAAAIARSKLATTTRRIHLPMGGWVVGSAGTFVISGQNRLFQMDDTVQSYMHNGFMVPYDYVSGTTMTINFMIQDGTVAGNAYMTAIADVFVAGSATSNTLNSASALAMSNTNANVRAQTFTLPSTSLAAGVNVGLKVGRLGDNASDTCNGTSLYFIAVSVDYTANT